MKIDPHKAVDFILENAKDFAAAKAQRIYLEEFRKSKKALLMKESFEETVGAQEREAYAHVEYRELLKGLKEAIEIEEKLRWDLIAAQARIDVWRSQEASNRSEGRVL
ncbi:hypothetical protein EBT16_04085 [bacterium]|nr:hypothetical protein [bacterium]